MDINEIVAKPEWKLTHVEFAMNNGVEDAEDFSLQDETDIKLDGDNLKITFTRKLMPDIDKGFSLSVSFEIGWKVIHMDELKRRLEKNLNKEEEFYLVAGTLSEVSLLITQIMRAGDLPLLITPPVVLRDSNLKTDE